MRHFLCFITLCIQGISGRFILLCFPVYFSGLHAQTSGPDSLRALLKEANNDSIRCQLLASLSETAPDGEWEEDNRRLKLLARQAFYATSRLSLKKTYLHHVALALNNEGLILGRMNLPAQEEARYRASYHLFKCIGDSAGMATALSNIGTKYLMRNRHQLALPFFMQSLAISEAIGDLSGKARILMSLGDIYRKTDQVSAALDYYEKSLVMSQTIRDDWQFALALRRMAYVYYNLYEYKKAAQYLRKSLAICKKAGDMDGYSEALTTLSTIDFNAKHYVPAEKGLLECLAVNEQYGLRFRDGEVLSHLASIQLVHHRNDTAALNYLFKADQVIGNDHELRQRVLELMARIYLQQGKPGPALLHGREALKLALQHRRYETAVSAARIVKQVYEKRGDYRQAFEVTDLINRLNDSLFDTRDQLSAVRSQYRSEYLMKAASDSLSVLREKAFLRSRIGDEQKNRYLLLLSFAILFLLALLALQKYRQVQKQKVAALRNDIANDLHDEIGASISSIKLSAGFGSRSADLREREHALKNIEQTSLEIARSISDIIWSIKPGNDDFILMLDKMQRFGQELCRHANIAFSFRYKQIEADPVFSYMERKHIYLIFREALHNAVKHSGASDISAFVSFRDKMFTLKLSDNGCGFDTTEAGKGTGQLSMRERAKAIGGSLQVSSEKGKYTEVLLECRISRSVRQAL